MNNEDNVIYEQHLYLEHKGYTGSIEYSDIDKCYHGKIDNISDLITYEAQNVLELSGAFIEAVDDYIDILARFKN